MKTIFTNKLTQIFFVLCFTIFLTSCDKVNISFYTEIFEDGSAKRKIQYAYTPSNESQLKFINSRLPDILQKGFVLPQAPEWQINKKIEGNAFYYIAEKQFDSINKLKSDYHKLSNFYGASKNYISFDFTDGSSSKDYNYLEVFKDSSDIKNFTNEFLIYLKTNKQQISKELYSITKDEIPDFKVNDAENIVELFLEKTESFNNTLKTFEIIGPRESKIINNEFERLDKDIKIGDFIDALNDKEDRNNKSKLIKMFRIKDSKISMKAKQNLSEKLHNLVKQEFSKVAMSKKIDPLGAYFTSLDMLNSYRFEYVLKMPGNITNSNGTRLGNDTVQWIFTPEDFFNHDYVIIAKSSSSK